MAYHKKRREQSIVRLIICLELPIGLCGSANYWAIIQGDSTVQHRYITATTNDPNTANWFELSPIIEPEKLCRVYETRDPRFINHNLPVYVIVTPDAENIRPRIFRVYCEHMWPSGDRKRPCHIWNISPPRMSPGPGADLWRIAQTAYPATTTYISGHPLCCWYIPRREKQQSSARAEESIPRLQTIKPKQQVGARKNTTRRVSVSYGSSTSVSKQPGKTVCKQPTLSRNFILWNGAEPGSIWIKCVDKYIPFSRVGPFGLTCVLWMRLGM